MNDPVKYFNLRIKILASALLIWGVVVLGKLVDLQILRNAGIRERILAQHRFTESIPSIRGEILDINGKPLAISQHEPFVFADPQYVDDPRQTVAALAKVLKKNSAWQKEKVKRLSNKNSQFEFIAKRVSVKTQREIEALALKGIYFDKQLWRNYPNKWTASHLLGFMNADGSVREGLEWSYDEALKGREGKRQVFRDGRRKRMDLNATVIQEPDVGSDIRLTIDANIQVFVEHAIRRGIEGTRAANISAIVINPQTGAIDAMANAPDFNPNRFGEYDKFNRKNRAVIDTYDPASAFKIVTVAAALDAGYLQLSDRFDCQHGGIELHGEYIRDHKSFGTLSAEEILWQSSNVGAIKIAHLMPRKVFFDYIQRFGFGKKTGIDLPAEADGLLNPLAKWTALSPAYLSIGHEISVTPLQMLVAACAIANGGKLVQPHVVKQIIHGDGRIVDNTPRTQLVQVIKPETAAKMAAALRGVVEVGTAKSAQVPGLEIFGKTGTAQRFQQGAYSRDKFNASFVGFFPADRPRFGIIVVVHDPKGPLKHGGEVATPIFAEIARQIQIYEVAARSRNRFQASLQTPDWTSRPVAEADTGGTMPDLHGMGLRNLLYQCGLLRIKPVFKGEGTVFMQWPLPGEPIPRDGVCKVFLKEG